VAGIDAPRELLDLLRLGSGGGDDGGPLDQSGHFCDPTALAVAMRGGEFSDPTYRRSVEMRE
jgi:hypothetical protein